MHVLTQVQENPPPPQHLAPDLVQVKEEIKKLREMTSAQYRDLLPDSEGVEEPAVGKKSKRKAIDPSHAELLK